MATQGGTAVVADLGAALEVSLASHPSATGAPDQASQGVASEGCWLVADPGPGGDGRHGAPVLRFGQNRLVAPGALVATALFDDIAQIHPTPPGDVLDRLAIPWPPVRYALPVHGVGNFEQRALLELLPDPAHGLGFFGHHDELSGMDQVARGVAAAAVSERVVTTVSTVLEELTLHTGHALGVQIALQLVREAELPEHVSPGGPVEMCPGQVGHQKRHLATLEFVG